MTMCACSQSVKFGEDALQHVIRVTEDNQNLLHILDCTSLNYVALCWPLPVRFCTLRCRSLAIAGGDGYSVGLHGLQRRRGLLDRRGRAGRRWMVEGCLRRQEGAHWLRTAWIHGPV